MTRPTGDGVRAAIAASQARSRAVGERWRKGAEFRAVAAMFADCPLDCAEPAADRAEQLFADVGWASALIAPLLAALSDDPFFEPPLRASRDPLRAGALLFDCPAAAISACVIDASALADRPAPETVIFSGNVTVTRYLRGGTRLRRWQNAPWAEIAPLAPADGEVMRCDGRRQAQLIAGADRDPVILVATIRAGAAPLLREHRIADGALLRTASTDDRASRAELMLSFLRAAGRADAAACFEAATRDAAHHLRWAAIREWLGLDARAALARLAEMADADAHPEVRAAAGATLPRVRRQIEAVACPA